MYLGDGCFHYVNNKFAQVPRQIKVSDKPRGKLIIEGDELWSFVDNKDNEYWVGQRDRAFCEKCGTTVWTIT